MASGWQYGKIRIFSRNSEKNKEFWGKNPVFGRYFAYFKGIFGKKMGVPFDWKVGPRKYNNYFLVLGIYNHGGQFGDLITVHNKAQCTSVEWTMST